MNKIRTAIASNNKRIYTFHCIGCGHSHMFNDEWRFNGSFESPTFSPSLLNYLPDGSQRCHLFVRNGKIEYLNDCTHKYAGKIIDLEDVENEQ